MPNPKRSWVKTEQGERPTEQRMLDIVFQIEAGRDYKLISEQFQISKARISRIARRLGLPDGRKGPRKRSRTMEVNNFHSISAK